ncbi:MAG: LysM peptidoglycan-binding domain-containing protein [Bacteroidales bacterium]|nr:LysM peptidoglycan-binding domain-containing protein [Bacteroidales bacterium]
MSGKLILPFVSLMIAMMVPAAVSAQVPVEVSGEKMIIGGKIYYMHQVLKNQTLYSISKAYKVSIPEIERENVIPVSGIQTGQVLKIPSREGQSATPPQTQARSGAQPAQRPASAGSTAPAASPGYDAATGIKLARERIMYNGKAYYMHEVLKGQTLYSIARAYKVTILDIDRENAIPAGGIQAGQVLRIPASSSLTAQEEVVPPPATAATPAAGREKTAAATTPATAQEKTAVAENPQPSEPAAVKSTEVKTEAKETPEPKPQPEAGPATPSRSEPAAKKPQPEKKKIHKVQKGESLADIAKKYDITVQELKQANKGVIFAMPDMRLVIPVSDDNQ